MILSPLSSGTWLHPHVIPILTLVAMAACGSDAPSDAPGLNQESAGTEEARAVAGDANPDGTLVVGGRTLTFEVRACDTGEEQGPDLPTLYGSGTTPDAERSPRRAPPPIVPFQTWAPHADSDEPDSGLRVFSADVPRVEGATFVVEHEGSVLTERIRRERPRWLVGSPIASPRSMSTAG